MRVNEPAKNITLKMVRALIVPLVLEVKVDISDKDSSKSVVEHLNDLQPLLVLSLVSTLLVSSNCDKLRNSTLVNENFF